ncbi:MAG: site-specific integrase [Acidobacteriaceae bacterium]|nr:site-specific integrase [Acidobacteriaceae bacterium]
MAKTNGAGSIYQRGNIWWVQVYIDGKPIIQSSKSDKKSEAVKLRNKLLSKKDRGELHGGAANTVLVNELLDDVLKSDIKESTRYIWRKVIEKNIRPFFGKLKAQRLTTDHLEAYREKRLAEGRSHSTANRELSIVRTAFHNGRERTPPKVAVVPYFPIIKETTVRKGFLTDAQYATLRDSLPQEIKALFVTAYVTGIRKGELLEIRWPQVDFEERIITLHREETKGDEARTVPIVAGDMYDLLKAAHSAWPDAEYVFNRQGERIKDFRGAWETACIAAGVPDLQFHDLRRTAVRNMRRAGIPQVIRMKISGHKTDSMERRYNIVDAEDLTNARELLERNLNRW